MKKYIEKHLIAFWVVCSVVYAAIIHGLFCIESGITWIEAKWGAGDILTYASTVSLGLLAVWQNKKIQSENDKAQDRMAQIAEYTNMISIINKIVDYEGKNLERLRTAIIDFAESTDPKLIVAQVAKNPSNSILTSVVMTEAEEKLEASFYALSRELRIDISIKNGNEHLLKKAVCESYLASKELINDIQQEQTDSYDKDSISALEARDNYLSESEKYLREQENKMNRLLYENLKLDEIKEMYKRVEN